MKTKCYSVRLASLTRISDKCYKATDFQGNSDLIPVSQVFADDYDVQKSEAYWISAWILERKNIIYSTKKERWFDENGNMLPNITIEHHVPAKVESLNTKAHADLTR